MRLSIYCLCAFLALQTTACYADDILIELAYNPGNSTWQLFGAVVDGTPDTVDGSNGIAAFLLTINGIDFGTDADAINFAPGIGAITSGTGSPTAIDMGSGDIEFLYGQDVSEILFSVVTGVGVGGKTLIADGTYSVVPTISNGGLDATFLNSATSPFGTVDPDNIQTLITIVPEPSAIVLFGLSTVGLVYMRRTK